MHRVSERFSDLICHPVGSDETHARADVAPADWPSGLSERGAGAEARPACWVATRGAESLTPHPSPRFGEGSSMPPALVPGMADSSELSNDYLEFMKHLAKTP